MSVATDVNDTCVSGDAVEILRPLNASDDVSDDVMEVVKKVTKMTYPQESREQNLPGNMMPNYLTSADVMSEDSMSTDSSDESDLEHDIVTDDDMSDDENDAVYEMVTCDANIVNDSGCVNDSVSEDQDVHQSDSTTYYILNLTTDPDKLGHGDVHDVTDASTDVKETVAKNVETKTDCSPEGTEKTFKSRLARIKAFFSKKEKCETLISTESDSGITADVSEDLVEIDVTDDVTENVSDDTRRVESCVSKDMSEDVNLPRDCDDDDGDDDDDDDMSDDSDDSDDSELCDAQNIPDNLSEGFFSLKDGENGLAEEVFLVTELQDTINALHSEYLAWRKSRLNSIKEIYAMADSLDGHQRNVDIAKVTGTSVGAAATVAGIVFTSLALAPVTAGSSLFVGLGIGAGVVGGAGVGTGIGAVVTKKKLERGKWERLQQIVTEDQEITDSLRMTIERYDHVLTSVTNLVKEKEEMGTARTILQAVRGTHTLAEKITVSVLKDVIRSAAGVTTEAVEGGAKAALVAGRVLGGIGIALGGIALVIDIIYLVQVGRNIRSGSKCDVAKRLRNVAKVLEDEMIKIDEVLAFDLAMSSSRSCADISRSAIYDIHDLGEDDLEFNEMTFGKLHIDTSVINWSDDEIID